MRIPNPTTPDSALYCNSAINAAIVRYGNSRSIIAESLRWYRNNLPREESRILLDHIIWIGYPVK